MAAFSLSLDRSSFYASFFRANVYRGEDTRLPVYSSTNEKRHDVPLRNDASSRRVLDPRRHTHHTPDSYVLRRPRLTQLPRGGDAREGGGREGPRAPARRDSWPAARMRRPIADVGRVAAHGVNQSDQSARRRGGARTKHPVSSYRASILQCHSIFVESLRQGLSEANILAFVCCVNAISRMRVFSLCSIHVEINVIRNTSIYMFCQERL